MKPKQWKESPWISSLKLVKSLPFEDGVFNSIYRAVLLRNVEFCKVITIEDRASCIRMTNKFIHQAIFIAFGINNEEISVKELIKNIRNDYDLEKKYYFFYIVYQELIRRNNPSSSPLLKELRGYEFQEPFKSIFKCFDSKLAWDFLLFDLAHQELNENMFAEMWFRYKGSLLDCPPNKYSDFIFRQYLKDAEKVDNLTKNNKKQALYSLILERAEKRYLHKEIFKAV
tara:strand:+ start:1063 stop:1746 length:684 start_codon:yes stop_codon:yes gene_type:complete